MHYTADRQGNCFFIFLGSQQELYPRVGCIPCVVLVARVPKTAHWRSCPIFFLAEEAEFSHSRNKSCPLSLPFFRTHFSTFARTLQIGFQRARGRHSTCDYSSPEVSLRFPWLPVASPHPATSLASPSFPPCPRSIFPQLPLASIGFPQFPSSLASSAFTFSIPTFPH